MKTMLRAAGSMLALLVLSGCPSTSVRTPAPTPQALPEVGAPEVRGATIYTLNPDASTVSIHVYRGGTLSRLGHNHVMTSKHVTGRAWVHSSVERSGFELSFPVAQLIVDDPQARIAAGSEFPGEISEEDRAGTKKNMLRAEVLDAAQFPTISLRSVRVSGTQQQPELVVRIKIKDVARDVTVPASVTFAGTRMSASGRFDIQQTSFGIKPFSIGLGALEVLDKLQIEFKLVGERS